MKIPVKTCGEHHTVSLLKSQSAKLLYGVGSTSFWSYFSSLWVQPPLGTISQLLPSVTCEEHGERWLLGLEKLGQGMCWRVEIKNQTFHW